MDTPFLIAWSPEPGKNFETWKTALFGDLSWKTGYLASFNDKTWKKNLKNCPFWTKIG